MIQTRKLRHVLALAGLLLGAALARVPREGGLVPSAHAASELHMNAAAERAHKAGQKAYLKGDLAGAKKQFEAAIAADKKAYESMFSLGAVEERRGKKADAEKRYREALAAAPDFPAPVVALAMLTLRAGDADGAARLLEERAAKAKYPAPLLAALAEVKSQKGASGDAQRLAQEALKVDPAYSPAMVALARDHYRSRRVDLALYALTGILDGYGTDNPARAPKDADAHFLRGVILSERGQTGPAITSLTRAAELRPDLVEAQVLLGTYMLEAGNAAGALVHLKLAAKFDGKNVTTRLLLGDAYRLTDAAKNARAEFEWVKKAAPDRLAARYGLGLVFLLSSSVPGMTPIAATDAAIKEFEAYKAKAPRGGPDDVDELIMRAKSKKALLEGEGKGGDQ